VAWVEQLQQFPLVGNALGLHDELSGRRAANLWARLTNRPWLRSIATSAALPMRVSALRRFSDERSRP